MAESSTIEAYTRKTAAVARSGSSSWSELMKELYESSKTDPRPSLQGEDVASPEAVEAIGRARAVTLPDGQVWTVPNGVNLWREGPTAGLITHWEKGRPGQDGLMARAFAGTLNNSGRIQDTFARFGEPKEWHQFRFTFTRESLVELAGSEDRETLVAAARELARTIHASLHEGPKGGTRMVISGPVHFDTAVPHVDFFVHGIEIDPERNDIVGPVDLGHSSELKDEVLRIRTAVRDRHGYDFESFKANNRLIDLQWDMPKSKAERLAAEGATAEPLVGDELAETAAIDGEGAPAGAPVADAVASATVRPSAASVQLVAVAPAFRRPIAVPELVQVQQYRKAVAREADELRRTLEEAEARERFAEHVESAFLVAEEAKVARDAATQRAETAEATAAEATAERDDLAGQLATTTAERDDLAGKLAAEEEGHALTSQHLEQAEARAKRIEAERNEQATRAGDAEKALAETRDELRERTDELTAARAELVSEKAETAAAIERGDRLAADLESATSKAAEAEAEAVALREALATAHAEAEQAKAAAREAITSRDAVAASLDTIRAALATTEGALATEKAAAAEFRELAAEVEEADAVPPGGTGLDGVAIDRRHRDPSAAWPQGAEFKRGWFGRARITTVDGARLTVQRGAVRVVGGGLTPDAIAAMVTHAQREGWSPVALSGDERTRTALADAARAAGLVLEGEEAGLRPASASPAVPAQAPAAPPAATAPAVQQGRPQPGQTFMTKAPAQWSRAEREAAEKAFVAVQDRARERPEGDRSRERLLAMKLDDWGMGMHDRWRKEQPPEASGDGTKPKPPKPE